MFYVAPVTLSVATTENYSFFLKALYWNTAAGSTASDKWLFTSYLVPFFFWLKLLLNYVSFVMEFALCSYVLVFQVCEQGGGGITHKGATLKHLHDLRKRGWGGEREGGGSLLLHFARQPYESIVFILAAARSPSGAG